MILQIIQAIMAVFANICPKPPTPSDIRGACQSPTAHTAYILEANTRRQLRVKYGWGAYYRYNGAAIERTILKTGSTASGERIMAVQASAA